MCKRHVHIHLLSHRYTSLGITNITKKCLEIPLLQMTLFSYYPHTTETVIWTQCNNNPGGLIQFQPERGDNQQKGNNRATFCSYINLWMTEIFLQLSVTSVSTYSSSASYAKTTKWLSQPAWHDNALSPQTYIWLNTKVEENPYLSQIVLT